MFEIEVLLGSDEYTKQETSIYGEMLADLLGHHFPDAEVTVAPASRSRLRVTAEGVGATVDAVDAVTERAQTIMVATWQALETAGFV